MLQVGPGIKEVLNLADAQIVAAEVQYLQRQLSNQPDWGGWIPLPGA